MYVWFDVSVVGSTYVFRWHFVTSKNLLLLLITYNDVVVTFRAKSWNYRVWGICTNHYATGRPYYIIYTKGLYIWYILKLGLRNVIIVFFSYVDSDELDGLRPIQFIRITQEHEPTTDNVTIVMNLDHIVRTALQFCLHGRFCVVDIPFCFYCVFCSDIFCICSSRDDFMHPSLGSSVVYVWGLFSIILPLTVTFFIPHNFNFRCPYFVSCVSYHGYFSLSCHVCILFCSTEPWILQNVCHSFHFIRLPTGSELKNLINNYHLNNKNNVWSLSPLAADECLFLFLTFIHKELAQILR